MPSPKNPIEQNPGEGNGTGPGGGGGGGGDEDDDDDDCGNNGGDDGGEDDGEGDGRSNPRGGRRGRGSEGGGNGGPVAGTMDHPRGSAGRGGRPVNLATGDKLEYATDLRVRLTGPDYRLRRYYTSHHDPNATWLAGEGWMIDSFQFLHVAAGTGGSQVLTLYGSSPRQKLVFTHNGSGKWVAPGPATQHIVQSTVTVEGSTINTWKWVEPGSWAVHFFRDTGPLEGLISAREDEYGTNLWVFTYQLYGQSVPPFSNDGDARLKAIYLNARSDQTSGLTLAASSEAVIHFAWTFSSTEPDIHGKLDTVWVTRYDPGTSKHETVQWVDYTYKAEVAGAAADLGSDGDLVEVTRAVRVDLPADPGIYAPDPDYVWGSRPFWSRVTHYRYHDGSAPASGTGDERLELAGDAHQLKMAIYPEQMEYFAQQYSASTTADLKLRESAAALLLQNDDWTAFNDGGLAGPARKVVDLAGKLVHYNTSGADDDLPRRDTVHLRLQLKRHVLRRPHQPPERHLAGRPASRGLRVCRHGHGRCRGLSRDRRAAGPHVPR